MKTYTLAVTGTKSYMLRRGPSRIEWSGRAGREPGETIIIGRRKKWWEWWPELVAWHVWKRWRKTRIRFER